MVWPLDEHNVATGLPLEGIRVLDFSRVLAGPLVGMILGDLGADVIKVEGPEGDPVRSLKPPVFGGVATYYLAVNRHKRNISADLRNTETFTHISQLVAEADVVVENYLPSQVRALKIDELRLANPDCVWVSITPATSGSKLADQPSFDLLAQARSGLMGVTGTAEGDPTKVGSPLADVVTGLYGTIAALVGLVARLSDRPGRHFEAPLLESTMSALINQAQGYLATGVNPMRLGNDHPSIAPYGPVRSRDGLLLLAVGTDGQYARLVELLSDPELSSHEEWSVNDQRVVDREILTGELNRIFGAKSTDEWLTALEPSGVPHAPVLDVAGAFSQEVIVDGDFVSESDSSFGKLRTMGTPLLIDGKRPPVRQGPHQFGEDNTELLDS
jgi:crotonobetainyl-CoA:carnitine CoA-transferase CaiB-like acyl-CoA transferase